MKLLSEIRTVSSKGGHGITSNEASNPSVAITGAGSGLGRERRTLDTMTPEQRGLYAESFTKFAEALNSAQSSGLSAQASADRVIELVEQQQPPIRSAVGEDAEQILRLVRENSDEQLDLLRLRYVGLA